MSMQPSGVSSVEPIRRGVHTSASGRVASMGNGASAADSAPTGPAPLATLLRRLDDVARGRGDDSTVRSEVVRLARELTNAESASYSVQESPGAWRVVACVGDDPDEEAGEAIHRRSLRESASGEGVARIWLFDQLQQRSVITAPIEHEGSSDCISVRVRLGKESPSSLVVALQLVAASAARAWQHRAERRAKQLAEVQLQAAAATVELQQRIAMSGDLDEACGKLAHLVREVVACSAVLVAWSNDSSRQLELRGVSPTVDDPHERASTRLLEAATRELGDQPEVFFDECGEPTADPNPLADAARQWGAEAVWIVPIRRLDFDSAVEPASPTTELVAGLLLLVGEPSTLREGRQSPFVPVVAAHVGALLEQAQRTHRGGRPSRVARWLERNRRRLPLLLGGIVVGALAFVPVPQRILGGAVCEPHARRFVVAPYAGLLQENLCQPGDLVTAGQRLARLDDRELLLERSSLAAEREIAVKKRDVSLAAHQVADRQLAELEIQRLDQRLALLDTRRENLDLRSPIAGIVLSGNRETVKNQPVRIGQTLFEIAPSGAVMVEVAIAESDWRHVVVGQEVWLRWEGLADREFRGVVSRIRPRTEIRDHDNRFVVEVRLDDPASGLKPGMKGVGRMVGPPEALLTTWSRKLRYRWWP